ncbi:MAG: FHA domain-containing protein [Lachnospiraceae bacterium]|nr:FHA domain-containing protein [Lachnospiraceae bacterium]
MMENIQFKRNYRNTYAILKGVSSDETENYFGRTVLQNTIDGLIRPSIITIDGVSEVHYDITGMQSMESIFSACELKAEDVRKLMFHIAMLLRETEKYLLESDRIVFKPSFIFYDHAKSGWKMLYDFSGDTHSMLPLAEFLIERCDPTDEKATQIAYDFYDKTEAQLLSLDLLDQYLEKEEEEVQKKAEEMLSQETEWLLPDEDDDEKQLKLIGVIKNLLNEKSGEAGSALLAFCVLMFAAYKIVGMWFLFTRTETILWLGSMIVCALGGAALLLYRWRSDSGSNDMEEDFLWDEEEQQIVPDEEVSDTLNEESGDQTEDTETVYVEKAEYHKNHSLAELRKGQEITHYIEKYPYVIGKEKSRVHLVIKDRGVSGVHARIVMENDEVMIEDLCSVNGTFINDHLIEPHEKTILHRGDILIFGSSEFVFR